MWSFSPESEVLLKHFLDSMEPPDKNNKWIQKFGARNINSVKRDDIILCLSLSDDTEAVASEINVLQETEDILKRFENSDIEFASQFKYLEEKCIKCPELLLKLGETLPVSTTELLFHYIFSNKDINNEFLNHFSKHLIPVYLKRNNGSDSHDLLTKLFRIYPQHFKTTFQIIIKDLTLPENNNTYFILSLKPEETVNFLNIFFKINLTQEEFRHNLSDIFTAYQACSPKTDNIQNNIYLYLNKFSKFCIMDKYYGHLLRVFITSLDKQEFIKIKNDLEQLVLDHKSVVRKVCDVSLRNATNKHCL